MKSVKTVKVTDEEMIIIKMAETITKLKAIVAEWEAKYGKIPELKDL